MSCSTREEYDSFIVEAALAARDAAYAFIKDRGHETTHEGQVVHTEVYDDVMWAFIRIWGGHIYSPYIRLLDFEGLLYPNNSSGYEGQQIPKEVADIIIKKAAILLETDSEGGNKLTDDMVNHLTWIVENGLPYGVKVEDV